MVRLFVKRMAKNKKGFTLVELMIVIAIIGILAVVLIPQAAKMRENAKLAGVDANLRMVQAQIEAVIDDNDTPQALATALAARLGTSITNPIVTSKKTAFVVNNTTPVAGDVADSNNVSVAIFTPAGVATAFTAAADTYFAVGGITNVNLSGAVVVAITGTGKTLTASLYTDDAVGAPRTAVGKAKTVAK